MLGKCVPYTTPIYFTNYVLNPVYLPNRGQAYCQLPQPDTKAPANSKLKNSITLRATWEPNLELRLPIAEK